MNVLVWFKRDLRLHDHPALTLAAGFGPVLPVHVVEPERWAQPDASARQWEFVAESLADLREGLAGIGAPLVVRVGDAVQVLAGLCRRHGIIRIVSHVATETLWTQARDGRVAAWAQGAGVEWLEVAQSGVARRPVTRDIRGASRDGFMSVPALPVPALRALAGVEPGLIPNARALRLAADPCPHRQLGGRTRGVELMASFLSHRGEPYRTALSSPVTAERACSRLSPHLAHGTLSVREVVQASAARQAERPGGRWGGALSCFQSRLSWRDDFIQKLEDQPSLETCELHPLAVTRPRETDATRLAAWAQGETGLPFLDACMRYLRATGWLDFRMRALAISVASHHLALDWRATGAHLARMFTDYEPGIHWPQVQMQSGTAGTGFPRICNPARQGQDQDPAGAFTRRWLPELAGVPDAFLHEPWRWPEARRLLGHRYPEPIIDLTSAAREARDRIGQARRAAGIAEAAGKIVRHAASRPGAREGRRSGRASPSQAQLSLPF